MNPKSSFSRRVVCNHKADPWYVPALRALDDQPRRASPPSSTSTAILRPKGMPRKRIPTYSLSSQTRAPNSRTTRMAHVRKTFFRTHPSSKKCLWHDPCHISCHTGQGDKNSKRFQCLFQGHNYSDGIVEDEYCRRRARPGPTPPNRPAAGTGTDVVCHCCCARSWTGLPQPRTGRTGQVYIPGLESWNKRLGNISNSIRAMMVMPRQRTSQYKRSAQEIFTEVMPVARHRMPSSNN